MPTNYRQSVTMRGCLWAAVFVATLISLPYLAGGVFLAVTATFFVALPVLPPPLLSLWAVHGETRCITRLFVSAAIFVGFFVAAYTQVSDVHVHRGADGVVATSIGWVAANVVLLLFLGVLRTVGGWRLRRMPGRAEPADDDTALAPASGGDRWQFTIRRLLIWTAVVAVLCAGVRWLASEATEMSLLACITGLLSALAGLPVLALAWIVLADGRRLVLVWRSILFIAIVVGIVGGIMSFDEHELVTVSRMFEALAHVSGLVAAFIMRARGYRLTRTSRSAGCV